MSKTLTWNRFDLLPPRLFHDCLPSAFSDDYVHWYDHDNDEVIFRCAKQPWTTTRDSWRLKRKDENWCLEKGVNVLLDPKGHCALTLSEILRPLEESKHLHISLQEHSQTIDIALPRLHLDFSIPQGAGHILSRQYRGLTIDEEQSIGTLIGLTSKLVLRKAEHERQLLIPVPGKDLTPQSIRYETDSQHRHIKITIDQDQCIRAYSYKLDTITRRIIDNGDLQAKLLLCYLHALSSSWEPDPFTGYTGAESALTILRSQALWSFEVLSTDNVDLLALLARLSPVRKFYPLHESVMQQVSWTKDVSTHTQRVDFRTVVRDIFDYAQKKQKFYPGHDFENPMDKKQWRTSGKSILYVCHGYILILS